jgi:hypothetical protein
MHQENCGSTSYSMVWIVDDKQFKFLQKFGEMAIVKTGDNIKNILENQGAPGMGSSRIFESNHQESDSVPRCSFLETTFLQWARETAGFGLMQQMILDDNTDPMSNVQCLMVTLYAYGKDVGPTVGSEHPRGVHFEDDSDDGGGYNEPEEQHSQHGPESTRSCL